jgi:outer membrane murein-binding lipoprotein Lpp
VRSPTVALTVAAFIVLAFFAVRGCDSAGAGKPVPLRVRVAQLERRVSELESKVASLRTLICLQLPTC